MNSRATTNRATDAGTYNGPCYRTACQAPGAKWWNSSTRKFYCVICASLINNACRQYKEEPLCEYRESA